MATVGVIGLGKIGTPIARNLIASGHRVVGFRRSAMDEFAGFGGIPMGSAAEVGAAADIVLSCVASAESVDDVVAGDRGLLRTARPGQIIVELGSHPVREKQGYVAPLAAKGATYLDGEVSGTPGMVAARTAVIFMAGERDAATAAEPVLKGITDSVVYFGPFGAASRVKLINNLLVTINIASTAEAMALGLRAGVDVDTLVKAIASGSGASTQFAIRAPWMAERRFMPPQGTARGLSGYFPMIDDFLADVDGAAPLFSRAVEIFERAIARGFGDQDAAVLVDALGEWPRGGAGRRPPADGRAN
ncbi:MAG TPA: NAD(P)-dependent oxidoreductase [Hyphomicrobiales bacterium]|nr:NAD(P)-dependent oxidoreductase [Hyphomicrobiales bacterium]